MYLHNADIHILKFDRNFKLIQLIIIVIVALYNNTSKIILITLY